MVACPEIDQITGPDGAEAPDTPATTAVKTIVSPKFGAEGAPVTLMEAVDCPTTIATGEVIGREA